MTSRPLVTVMIATRDRGPELRLTLQLLRQQRYEQIDLLIIDDGSQVPIAPLVRELWPLATVIRHEESKGQCERRNEGFSTSRGEFILHLDDDCCLTQPGDLATAVQHLAERPTAGAVVFDLYNGLTLPEGMPSPKARAGCVRSFVGAAILFRTVAIRQTAGYRSFYQAQGEEEELGVQLLSKGWQIVYCPSILAHHRLSSMNRNSVATWRRGLGNDIWTLVLHLPTHRLPLEISWKLGIGIWDALRLGRLSAFCHGWWRCLRGLEQAWGLREPLSPLALRRYDALRLYSVLPEAMFGDPPALKLAALGQWWSRWRSRARDTSFWEPKAIGTGSSNIARYAHEFQDQKQ